MLHSGISALFIVQAQHRRIFGVTNCTERIQTMAYASQNTVLRQSRLVARLHGLRDMLHTVLQQRAVYNRTLQELQALSNRELADLGIHRSEIPRIAAEAAFKA
jgi:uncharacterized protein YjiS (DUF1127 family)